MMMMMMMMMMVTNDVTCFAFISAWFDDNSDDVMIRHISRRVSDVTGLNTTQPTAEPLQVNGIT